MEATRECFESWYASNAPCGDQDDLKRDGDTYANETTALLWSAWNHEGAAV